VRSVRIVALTAALMVGAGLLLLPLPDICDRPGSLVLCLQRASAVGLLFERASPWPTVGAVTVLAVIAVVGAGAAVRAARRPID